MFLRNLQLLLIVLIAILVVVVVVGVLYRPGPAAGELGTEGYYLFCFWNVENFFDDRRDPERTRVDQEYDIWFAEHPEALRQKLDKLCEALLKVNDGKGPDLIAVVEVESLRAAELLQQALNGRLADATLHYQHVLMKEVSAGRHIAPAILSRLPVAGGRTRLLDKHLRILESHVEVGGHDLVLVASHWTSRLQGGGVGRDKYASRIYGEYKAMYLSDPAVDLLVCGDFNDTPGDESVTGYLHAVADPQELAGPPGEPRLLDLFAAKDPLRFGTHYYHGKWLIFDHILVSPGMLDDRGWGCDPASAQTINNLYRPGDRQHRPWRFGGPQEHHERGYSDHFPVTVKLHVKSAA